MIQEKLQIQKITTQRNLSGHLCKMIISDGSLLLTENYSSNIYLTIDVNGLNKKLNRWGHNLFTFQIDNMLGKLVPIGSNGTDCPVNNYCSKSSSDQRNGIGCTYKALTDASYFKNLPK